MLRPDFSLNFFKLIFLWLFAMALPFSTLALAATLKVPQDHPSLQSAIDAAQDGDEIRLGPGRHCGAFLEKRLVIRGEGEAVIKACPEGPTHPLGVAAGIWLSSAAASGSVISHLTFDGAGISNTNLSPLGLAIFSRALPARDTVDYSGINVKINNITIEHNTILGTAQPITNTGGDNWVIHHNSIEGFSALDCATGAMICAGGLGIEIRMNWDLVPTGQNRSRPANTIISHNKITGLIPDTLTAFSFAGILLMSADYTNVENNSVSIPDNPKTDAAGVGIWVDSFCCDQSYLPNSHHNTIINNDGRGSEYTLVVNPGNANQLTLRGNLGVNLIEDQISRVKNRSIATLRRFQ